MNITCLLFAFIFTICSFLLFNNKAGIFIPNWKNLTKEEKEEISIRTLSINMGVVLSICAIILLASGLFHSFREHFFSISMVLWLIGTGIDVYIIDKNNKK